jgi:hypothetical protein
MSTPLVSLREAADDSNADKCYLQTVVELHVGDVVTRWVLELDAQRWMYDDYGRMEYFVVMSRADIEFGEGEPPPEVLWSYAPLVPHLSSWDGSVLFDCCRYA